MKTPFIYGLLICCGLFITRNQLTAQDVYAGFAFGPAYQYLNTPHFSLSSYNTNHVNVGLKPVLTFSLNAHLSWQSSKVGLTFEPGYIKKGGRNGDFQKNGWSVQNNYHFIQLPLLFDIYVTPRIYISLGGDFSYLLPFGTNNPGPENASPEFYDIAAVGSISYSLTSHLDLALRYNYGFRTQPGYSVDVAPNFSYTVGGGKNMHGQLLLRVKFGGSSGDDQSVEN